MAQNIHKDHRNRTKERFRQEGLEKFEDHQVLELLLFYTIPMKDTNPLAHELINTFGSLNKVFDASIEDLTTVEGIQTQSATFIKMIPQLCSRYYAEKVAVTANTEDNIIDYIAQKLIAKFIREVNEVMYLICLDNSLNIICFQKLGEGTTDAVSILTRKILEIAIRNNANSVIIAHNHPTGLALPSKKDRQTTTQLYNTLNSVSIKLLDHIIVAGKDYFSMAQKGQLSTNLMSALRSGSTFGIQEVLYEYDEPYEEGYFDMDDFKLEEIQEIVEV